jgi:hypothetical protein
MRLEEVYSPNHEMLYRTLRTLCFDADATGTEHFVIGCLVLLGDLEARHRFDIGLGWVIHATEQIAVRMGNMTGSEHTVH